MSDLTVRLTASDGYSADVQLNDVPGPINRWRSITPGAFGIQGDNFINQTNTLSARGCGVRPCWELHHFDIDVNKTGDTGAGENYDISGQFPAGKLTWEVL